MKDGIKNNHNDYPEPDKNTGEGIPVHDLMHNHEKVFFAYRTMEENHVRLGGKPDVPHRHEYYTVLLVKNVCGWHYIDFKEYIMNPGTVFFVSPGQVHQVIVNNNDPSGDIMMFNCEFLARNYINEGFIRDLGLFSEIDGTPPLHPDKKGFETLLSYSAEIGAAFASDSPFKFDTIAAYLKLFLIECNKFAVPSQNENPQAIQSGKNLVREFRNLLDEKHNQWHKVNEYADQLNITPDYLNNVLRNATGKSAKEMILFKLVVEAKRMGVHTGMSNKEIAFALGFEDPAHFSKLFKKMENQSFSNFRQQLEKSLIS